MPAQAPITYQKHVHLHTPTLEHIVLCGSVKVNLVTFDLRQHVNQPKRSQRLKKAEYLYANHVDDEG